MSGPPTSRDNGSQPTDIAVIGMACRFPGANNTREFWSLLREGREALTALSDEQLRAAGVPESLLNDPDYVKVGMHLQEMEQFDAGFFGFSPLDARILDPQHRHFLECTWEALEDAGYDPARYNGSIGVFAGSGHNAYLPYNLLSNPQLVADVGFFLLRHTGNDKDFLTTRASYCLDLRGPSVNVQTACSTSLVAVHLAAQSLLNAECDMALAGGVTIELPHHQGYLYKESEILSPDGHCRPFDASAGGTVFGSGVGVVMLKRLNDAIADGDNIHAVIKASAVNNDGAGKVSYLAPSVDGQAASIHEALLVADIEPQSVTYIEAHGTGTQLGDPIEVAALRQAYAGPDTGKQYCGIGSVKSNIGHLDTAAGVASLIKVILALRHRQLPATLHYRALNPGVDLSDGPFFVNSELREWTAPSPLRAGVSALGVGGTNAHVIVEESPRREAVTAGRSTQLLLLSARSSSALAAARQRLSHFLRNDGKAESLADVTYTLAVGRREFRKRSALVVTNHDDAVSLLEADSSGLNQVDAPDSERRVAFMFAGGGAQYPNMGRGLYDSEPVYRQAVDECLKLVSPFVEGDLRSLLYPGQRSEASAAIEMERPSRSLPLLFITQYAQARLWQAWGVQPAALIGHSMGENTAGCIAGVFSLRDALGLVALRGKLFETLPEGGMLSVNLSAGELEPMLRDGLGIAARNAPELSVVSGPVAALRALEQELKEHDISSQRIRINVAAHSAMLEPILKPFGDYLRSVDLQSPTLPFISNLTGTWITSEQAKTPEYWVRHLRETVLFADGVGSLLQSEQYALLEVGPGRTLASLATLHESKRANQQIATSLPHPEDRTPDLPHMLAALGRLWQNNVTVDWSEFFRGQERRRVSLPTYAFDHARYWVEPGKLQANDETTRKPLDDWFHTPVWVPQPAPPQSPAGGIACLIGPADQLSRLRVALLSRFDTVIEAVTGQSFAINGDLRYQIGNTEADYGRLIRALKDKAQEAIHFYLASGLIPHTDDAAGVRFHLLHLFHLARALSEAGCETASLVVVTRSAMRLPGDAELANPGAAALSGAFRVVANELHIPASFVDLPLEEREELMLSREQPVMTDSPILAYRSGQRLQLGFQKASIPAAPVTVLRDKGVYLITGGLGGIGLELATHLAARGPVKLALIGRQLPPKAEEASFYRASGGHHASMLDGLDRLEKSGAEMLLLQADVAVRSDLETAIQKVEQRWGRIDGVFHAAGILADSLLPLQDAEAFDKILAPKVDGTLNLAEALFSRPLDFVILFSSSSAFAGIPGQFAYAAANAFLDSFAQTRAASGWPVMAVNWAAWKDVGMTAALAGAGLRSRAEITDAGRNHVSGRAYRHIVDGRDWLVDQHRTRQGIALLPGTGFVELAILASAAMLPGAGVVAVKDLFLLQPLVIDVDERVVVSVVFEPDGEFHIYSSADGSAAERGDWAAEHAQGRAERRGSAPSPLRPTDTDPNIKRVEAPADHRVEHAQMEFGPRWHCVETIAYGDGEAIVRLKLDKSFAADLKGHPLHPAMLDMATGAAQGLIPDFDPQRHFFVPQSYGEVIFHAPLVADMESRIIYSANSSTDRCVLDVRVADSAGKILVEVNSFTLRRLAAGALNGLKGVKASRSPDPQLQETLRSAIRVTEGMQAIDRLLANPGLPRVLVSPHAPETLLYQRRSEEGSVEPAASAAEHHERPAVRTDYVAPSTELEKKLAALWQEGLGIGAIGTHDDFFELGGHSLLMIQLVNRARKHAGINLPLTKLYGRPTIAGWVELAQEMESDNGAGRPALKRVAREAYRTREDAG